MYGPAPGFVTGGANPNFSVGALSPPSGQPLQKSYLEFNDGWPNNSWEISEPAIYYQAAYLRLIASIVGVGNIDNTSGGCTNTNIDSSNFETGFQFWNDGGRNCKRVRRKVNSGAWFIMLRGRTNSSHTSTDELDLSAFESITIDFSYIVESFDNASEDFWLQKSEDGESFVTLEEWNLGDEFENLDRKFDSVSLNGPFSTNTRFRFKCHASGSRDWVYLDDNKISGCSSIALPQSVISDKEKFSSNFKPEFNGDLSVYPNPAEALINIEFTLNETGSVDIRIVNLNGQVILKQQQVVSEGNQKIQIPIDNFVSGFYIIQLRQKEGLQSKKFYKE